MRTGSSWLAAWVAAALACTAAIAAEQPSPVRLMMEKTGIVDQFAQFGERFGESILNATREEPGLPEENAVALADITGETMDGGRLLADLERHLTDSLVDSDLSAVVAFYESPLGANLKMAERRSAEPAFQARLEAGATELLESLQADAPRRAVFERMDRALLASELSATTAEAINEAMFHGLVKSLGPEVDREMLEQAFRSRVMPHDMMVETMRDHLKAVFAEMYKDVPLADLQSYAEFLDTRPARTLYAAFSAALDELMAQRGTEIGERFAAYLQQKKT